MKIVIYVFPLWKILWQHSPLATTFQFLIGLINGIILSAISLVVLAVRFHSFKVEMIFVASMIMMSIIATFIGTFIPIMLHRLKSDPAISSSILTSATTDILSAFIFLGLATIFLLNS